MKNFTKKYFAYRCFINLIYTLFVLFLFVTSIFEAFLEKTDGDNVVIESRYLLYVVIGYVVLYAIITIFSYLYYKLSGYEINDKQVIVKRGVLFKRKTVIDLENIHSVNSKQGIIQKLFKISTLLIDSGSTNTSHQAEASIIEDENVVNELIDVLKGKKRVESSNSTSYLENEHSENNSLYNFTSKRKVIYGLIYGTVFALILFFSIAFTMILSYVLSNLSSEPNSFGEIAFGLIICSIILIIGSYVIAFAYSFIRYYGFKLYKENDSLIIEYGLLVKVKNTMKLNRIKAIKVERGLLERMFKYATIKLEVIGYIESSNNGNGNQATIGVLVPLCKESEVNSIIESVSPSYVPKAQQGKAKSFISYFTWTNIILLFALIIPYLFGVMVLLNYNLINDLWIISSIVGVTYLLVNIIVLFVSLFDRNNQDIIIDDNRLIIYHGGIIRRTTIIQRHNVIAIEDVTTKWRKEKGIFSYRIHIRTNNMTNVIHVNFIDEHKKDELLNLLIF